MTDCCLDAYDMIYNTHIKVSRVVGQRPLEFIRRTAWASAPVRFGNGISAVTSLCLCDEASTGGECWRDPAVKSYKNIIRIQLVTAVCHCHHLLHFGSNVPGSLFFFTPNGVVSRFNSSSFCPCDGSGHSCTLDWQTYGSLVASIFS